MVIQGFEAVKEDIGNGKKAVNFWRLTPEAIRTGAVQSTTRYRKGSPKGAGRVAQRGPQPLEGHASKKMKTSHVPIQSSQQPDLYQYDHFPTELPLMDHSHAPYPSGLPSDSSCMLGFGMGPVSGVTFLSESHRVFVDSPEAGPDFTTPYNMGWYPPPGPNDRSNILGPNVPADPMLDCEEQ